MLRVDALGANDALARALDDAVRRLQAGEDATDALLRARRVAAGAPVSAPSLPRWGAGW